MTCEPARPGGGPVSHPPHMWCLYESRTVARKPVEHCPAFAQYNSREHARSVCLRLSRGGNRS